MLVCYTHVFPYIHDCGMYISLSPQMTTPETRRLQTDRKSSFLDNIGERSEQLAESSS